VPPTTGPAAPNWKPYVDKLPNDPWGRPYQYVNPGIKGEVDVLSLGADGQPTDELILVDEVLTPDSSRYWPADDYQPGRDQQSYDKQFVRNYLLELVAAHKWNKEAPGPQLPAHVVDATLQRYEEAVVKLGLTPFGAAR
jgi:hypothetical protein